MIARGQYCSCGWNEIAPPATTVSADDAINPLAVITTPPHTAEEQRGFSLLEVAISMIFYGLLIAGVAAAAKVDRAEQNQKVNPERLATISAALEQYRAENGFYPCPALPSAPVGTAEHGRAGDCTAPWSMSGFGCDADGVCVKAGRLYDHDDNPSTDPVPMRVREGAIPTTALNLPSSVAGDTYGRQFRYAVAEVLAADKPTYTKYESLGGIDIVTAANVSALDTPESTRFAVFGLGADGRGGYVFGSGRPYLPCIADRMDSINCDQTNSAKAVYRTASRAIPNDITAANYFDDFVEWQKPKAAQTLVAVSNQPFIIDGTDECPDGYEEAYTGRRLRFADCSVRNHNSAAWTCFQPAAPFTSPFCTTETLGRTPVQWQVGGISTSASGSLAVSSEDNQIRAASGWSAAPWGAVSYGDKCAVCVASVTN